MKDTKKLFELNKEIDAILVTSQKNRYYFTGFSSTAGFLLLTKTGTTFITDFRYGEMAAPLKKEGVEVVVCGGAETMEYIRNRLHSAGVRKLGFEDTEMTCAEFEGYRKAIPEVEFAGVGKDIEFIRRYKTPDELKNIAEAQAVTDKVFTHMLDVIRPGVTEIELAIELECSIRRFGGEGLAFDTIIASGLNGSKPHAHPTEKKIEAGDAVTMDFGARYAGYCSDMTRTVFVGKPSDKMKDIYDTVLNAQRLTLESIKPGMKGCDMDAIARNYIKSRGYGEYFQHSTGHSVGLDIHESPNLSPLCETIFEPTMLGTVEPGVYVEGVGGVRIEDLVIFTQDGIKDLTTSPKDIIIL